MRPSTKQAKRSHLIGQAGVYAVASQLLARGINVMFPAVDSGADLIAEGGIRLQIKTSRLVTNAAMVYPGYHFNLSSWKADENGRYHKRRRAWSDIVDFVIFCGIDENRFWIVPASLVGSKQHLHMTSEPQMMKVTREEVKRLRNQGLTGKAIAAQLGVSGMTVSRLLMGQCERYESSMSVAIRKLEGKWDLLVGSTEDVASIDSVMPANAEEKEEK